MFDTVGGLPVHTLIVHATVVTVPVAALVVLLAAMWPRFRRWAGLLPAVLALLAVVLVPISTESGAALEERVTETATLERHANLGEALLPWVIGLALVAIVLAWWNWKRDAPRKGQRAVAIVLALAALVTAGGTLVQVVLIGHSGAEAVWSDTTGNTPSGS